MMPDYSNYEAPVPSDSSLLWVNNSSLLAKRKTGKIKKKIDTKKIGSHPVIIYLMWAKFH